MELMPKIEMTIDEVLSEGKYCNGTFASIIDVYLKDGRMLEEKVVDCKGDATNRMKKSEIDEKFEGCAKRYLKAEGVAAIEDILHRLDGIADVNELVEAVNNATK